MVGVVLLHTLYQSIAFSIAIYVGMYASIKISTLLKGHFANYKKTVGTVYARTAI